MRALASTFNRRSATAGLRVFFGILISAIALIASGLPAHGASEYLEVSKTVDASEIEPGEGFTYTIQVTCSEEDCENATLVDDFPEELDGFAVQDVTFDYGEMEVPRTVTWTEGEDELSDQPDSIGADTNLTVEFEQAIAGSQTGLTAGLTLTITVSLQAPDDVAPGEYEFTNTANTTADNSTPDSDDATTSMSVDFNLGVDVTKSWTPADQVFDVGAESTIELGVQNTSNGPVDTLTLQEPQAASDGAGTLDDSNPFTITDLDDFDISMPDGAEQVQVDAYVERGGTYTWVTGDPSASAALPSDVDAADVAGLRVTFTGEEIDRQAEGTVTLDLAQRAEHRDSGDDLSVDAHEVDNTAEGSAGVGDERTTNAAEARHKITPPELTPSAGKEIAPNRISAGDSAQATITGGNDSNGAVSELRLRDLDYFTDDVTFGGFTEGIDWPAGAESAKVVYHLDGDGDTKDVPFNDGATPDAPGEKITGFEIVFEADGNGIQPEASASANFTIETSEDAVGEGEDLTTTNELSTTVGLANGRTSEPAESSDDLRLVKPAVNVELDKTVRPSAVVHPGEHVVTKLESNLTTTSDYVTANKIVIEDAWDDSENGFWNAFNLDSVAPTQVPGNTSLTIQVQAGDDWHDVGSFDAEQDARIVSLSGQEMSDALTGQDITNVTGIRFIFENADGFASDTTVTPYVTSTARDELRSGGDLPTGDNNAETFTNAATTSGHGTTESDTELEGTDEDGDDAQVADVEGDPGKAGIDKQWSEPTVAAQSSQQRGTSLSWKVAAGFETVQITDPSDATAGVEDTVFDAFNLVGIDAIGGSGESTDAPFTNAWYLKYDTISSVELYINGGWKTITPDDGWQADDGSFTGYTLKDSERADATGVRVTLEENTAAREAAQESGEAYDPYAPKPGTGVATSSASRTFDLSWQVRDKKRSDKEFVTETEQYNTSDAGTVNNTTGIDATPIDGGDSATDTASDTIQIKNYDPGVEVGKVAKPDDAMYVPMEGTTDADEYPAGSFTMTAHNDSVSRASYVRIMDPPLCSDTEAIDECQSPGTADGATADPFDTGADWLENSAFNRFNIAGVTIDASSPAQVDLAESVVWLLTYDGSNYDTQKTTAAAVQDLTAEDLADVVGISVTFQGENPEETGGTITQDNDLTVKLDTQLRATLRNNAEPQVLDANTTMDVNNRVFAQSYDPVLADERATGDLADDDVTLTGGDIKVDAAKSVAPDALTEPTRDDDVTVTLGADDGGSTLTTAEVRLTDDIESSPDFWDTFNLSGLGDIDAPEGADRVSVEVYGPYGTDDAKDWTASDPTPIDNAKLPDVDLSKAEGIRFVFDRDDGEFFSDGDPGDPKWQASAEFTVQLRDAYRESGEAVELSDEVDNVENTVTAISDRNNGEKSTEEDASAVIGLSPGSAELEVNKLANGGRRIIKAGQLVPWDLTIRNSGSGYLDITEVRDTLPEHLAYLGNAPEYTADDDGLLSEDVSLEQDGDDLVFTWPEGENRMKPGESFTIRVQLDFQAGLNTGERATNTMVTSTEQTLERCANTESGEDVTDDWENDKTTCGDSDYVQPAPGTNLVTAKGVIGDLDGASNPSTGDECLPVMEVGDKNYYRSPCAANSIVGGTDDWVLQTINGGTTNIDEVVLYDQLPVAGDSMLVSGDDRGSDYRPQLLDSLETDAPEGTEMTVEVTTSSGVCENTWGSVETADPCVQNGETWQEAGSDTDWSQVSGLRIWLDFTESEAGAFTPGQSVHVTYESKNMPATADDGSGAPVDVPVDDSYAWNQFGIKYLEQGRSEYNRIAPSKVGVHLVTGPIAVTKNVTGPASDYAPDTFDANVVCTIEGADVNMGDQETIELTDGETTRIDGIPLGAECTITESGDTGKFGETERNPGSVDLEVTSAAGSDDDVPETQAGTLGNTYEFADLSITKHVSTQADKGEFGPFDFELTCTTSNDQPVLFDGEVTRKFTLEDGETFDAKDATIPAGSVCTITELTSSPDEIVFTGDNINDLGDGQAEVTVDASGAQVDVTNGYDAGVLKVVKNSEGDGAERYGSGPFEFTAACTYDGQTLLDETFSLEAGSDRTFGTFPAGTQCDVDETKTAGANDATMSPESGTVEITGPDETQDVSEVTVTATNTFVLGELAVDKVVDGAGAELYGAGPFSAQVKCTWQRNGDPVDIDLPNDGTVELSQANDYAATVDGLLVGSTCHVTETANGGATSASITPDDGKVTIASEEQARVTLTNTFDVASLAVTKNIVGPVEDDTTFDVELACTRDVDGREIDVDIPGGSVRTLSAPDDLHTTYDTLPYGAECTVAETQTGGADDTTIAVAGAKTVDSDSVSLVLEDSENKVTITNRFDPADPQASGVLPGTGAGKPWPLYVGVFALLVGLALELRRRASRTA